MPAVSKAKLALGDVISIKSEYGREGTSRTVPSDLFHKYWRVAELSHDSAGEIVSYRLDGPYLDPECQVPYASRQ